MIGAAVSIARSSSRAWAHSANGVCATALVLSACAVTCSTGWAQDTAQDQPTGYRWIVVIEKSSIVTSGTRVDRKYRLEVSERHGNAKPMVLELSFTAARERELTAIVDALEKCVALAALDDAGQLPQASTAQSPVYIVLRLRTNNRRLDFGLSRDEADRLGVGEDTRKLIAVVNSHLQRHSRDRRPAPLPERE